MAEPLGSFSGIASGLDSRALVEHMMKLERRPADRLQAVIDTNTKRTDLLNRFKGLVQALKDAAAPLRDGSAFDAYSATVVGADVNGKQAFGAAATAGATPGTYELTVLTLASSQKTTAGAGAASSSVALGYAGTFEIRRLDESVLGSVEVLATDTLAQVRDKINALNAGDPASQVSASVVSIGGSDNRLVLSADAPGSAGAFKLVPTAGTALADLGLDTAGAVPPITRAASDATMELDGVPVTRSTNTISDLLPNVTLTLTEAAPTKTGKLTIERFTDNAASVAQKFADAYNAIVDFVAKEGSATATGPLRGDAMLRGARSLLSGTLLGGSASGAADLDTLASAGLSLDKTGKMSLDKSKLTGLVNTRLDDLKTMFADRAAAFESVATTYVATGTGLIDGRVKAMADQKVSHEDRILAIDSRLEKRKAALLAQYAKFEATIGRLNSLGDALGAQLKGLTASRDD